MKGRNFWLFWAEKYFSGQINNANSKSARSLKYPPHWRALQDFERNNAIFLTTQQLSRLHWMLKSFPKESDIIKTNNIFKLHQASWTINRDYIKFKFSFKVGLGPWSIRLRVDPFITQQHVTEKHWKITAQCNLGKTIVERVDIFEPLNLLLPIFYHCCPLLQQTTHCSS